MAVTTGGEAVVIEYMSPPPVVPVPVSKVLFALHAMQKYLAIPATAFSFDASTNKLEVPAVSIFTMPKLVVIYIIPVASNTI